MRGRADGDGLAGRIDPRLEAKLGYHRKARSEALAQRFTGVEIDAMTFAEAPPDRSGDNLSRRELRAGDARHEPLARLIDKDRAFAADGLAHQRRGSRRPIERGRMKLHEFQIRHFRAGVRRQREALTEAAAWIGAELVGPADAAGGDDDPVRRQDRRTPRTDGDDAAHSIVRDEQTTRLDAFENLDRSRPARRGDQSAHDFTARGVAAGMDDPPPGVRGLQAERQSAAGLAVEIDPEKGECFDRSGSLSREAPDHIGIAETVAGSERVRGVQVRSVVDADRSGEAALRPKCRTLGANVALRDEQYRPRRQMQRGHQPGDPGADDYYAPVEGAHVGRHSATIRSTATRARAASAGSMVTSVRIVSSARRIAGRVIRFICGQRLQGRTKSTSGCATATLSLIEHSVKRTTRLGVLRPT